MLLAANLKYYEDVILYPLFLIVFVVYFFLSFYRMNKRDKLRNKK